MMLRLLPLVLALAACAKQGQVRTTPQPPAPDLYHLCSDARFQSMCTPVPGDYQQVDTNLQWHRALVSSAG